MTEIFQEIETELEAEISQNEILTKIRKKIEDRNADYIDAHRYVKVTAAILARAFEKHLPTNIDQDVSEAGLRSVIEKMCQDVSNMVFEIQTGMYRKAKLGIKAILPTINYDRIDGIILKVLEEQNEK